MFFQCKPQQKYWNPGVWHASVLSGQREEGKIEGSSTVTRIPSLGVQAALDRTGPEGRRAGGGPRVGGPLVICGSSHHIIITLINNSSQLFVSLLLMYDERFGLRSRDVDSTDGGELQMN